MPKNPVMGSDNGVNGCANNRAPLLITRRYNGHDASIATPAPYRVPSTNSAPLANADNRSGTYHTQHHEIYGYFIGDR